jgi:predicted phosphodiesterase
VLAVLYDIHGNLPALDAVLEETQLAGADRYLLGGDYALFGAWPAETVARLRELDATWIRGNVDRWVDDPGQDDLPDEVRGAIGRCRELLDAETVAELGALPAERVEGGVRYCHASPLSDLRSFQPEADPEDEELLAGSEEARVVFGHTHLQFTRMGGVGTELVNPGSVGIPLDGDHRAAFALAHPDGRIELRRVEYDFQASADAVREVLGEFGETAARRIEQARFDV